MDWLRRNWPDLLIGVALIAVIAGIIATLISGGSFFPSGNRTVETPDPGTTAVTSSAPPASSAQPGATPAAGDPSTAAGTAEQGEAPRGSSLVSTPAAGADQGEAPSSSASDAAAEPAATATAADTADNTAGLPVAVLPGQTGTDAGAATPATQPTAPTTAAATPSTSSPSSTVSSTPSTAAAATTAAAASPAGSNTIVSASNTPDAPYRVSVGAYANRDNAQRQAEAFAAAGYPVFIGQQGNLNIVLVGPYDSESEARTVADRIRSSDMGVSDPTVYEFEGDEGATSASAATSGSSASSSTVTSSVSTSTASASPAAASSTAGPSEAGAADDALIATAPADAAGVRYLQAGAYGTRESSLPQRARLEGLGFVVTERLENDLVKLLIGPFDQANLESAQGRLEAAGIASFAR